MIFSIHDTAALCQHYLNIVFHDVKIQHKQDTTHVAATYGEIFYPGIEKIFSLIPMSTTDVFFDLGSGVGKLAVQVFLNTPVQAVYGIELLPDLHAQAEIAAHKIQQDLPDFYFPDRQLTFILGDFLEVSLLNATIVMVCSPCFTQEMLNKLGEILDKIPGVHTVLTLRPMTTLTRLKFKRAIRIDCSWDAALCYIYQSVR